MSTKINQLLREWPKGTVATQPWLDQKGISRKLANWYVKSNWLERFGPRAFVRSGDNVDWTGGLYALQTQLGMTVHAGARTALELRGFGHFLPLGSAPVVILVSDTTEHLPAWFSKNEWQSRLRHRVLRLFDRLPDHASTSIDCGAFLIGASSPERAIMEMMHMANDNSAVEHAHTLMRGLTTLRPAVVQSLLESCRSVKVRRLFLWSAESHGHAWFGRLKVSDVDMGSGKRQVFEGGAYSSKYQITVPPGEKLPDV
jgi:hypothetical protein